MLAGLSFWHKVHWPLPVFPASMEIAFVSYWEWMKLMGTAFLISCAMTAAAFAPVWIMK
jgi:hypothetical protein